MYCSRLTTINRFYRGDRPISTSEEQIFFWKGHIIVYLPTARNLILVRRSTCQQHVIWYSFEGIYIYTGPVNKCISVVVWTWSNHTRTWNEYDNTYTSISQNAVNFCFRHFIFWHFIPDDAIQVNRRFRLELGLRKKLDFLPFYPKALLTILEIHAVHTGLGTCFQYCVLPDTCLFTWPA